MEKRLRDLAHRFEIEAGRNRKPQEIQLENKKCNAYNVLEEAMHFLLE